MTEKASVRAAHAEDIDGLAALAARSFRDAFAAQNKLADIEDYVRDSLSAENLLAEFEDSRNSFFVATVDGHDDIAGYVKLRADSRHANSQSQRPIELQRLYADHPFIGFGVGAALMQSCLKIASERRCDEIWLGVWERNSRAIEFYERWEFAAVGAHEFKLGSDIQTDLIMVRALEA